MRPNATTLPARPLSLLLLFLLLVPCTAAAQSLYVYDVDPSGFPTITAGISTSDDGGAPIVFSSADLEVIDNGQVADNVVVECPTVIEELPFSAVLVNDRSGSMSWSTNGGMRRIDLLKSGVKEFIAAVPFVPPTAIAITAFDSDAFIVTDFQTSPTPLIAAIDRLTPDGGTEYNPPFLDPYVGAITMLQGRSAKYRRIIIFLTDGQSNTRPDVNGIINSAVAARIEVYTITIGMPMTYDLDRIASATGGAAFGNVTTEEQIREIYKLIAIRSRGLRSCRISWKAKPDCSEDGTPRHVTIRVKSRGISTSFDYTPPPGSSIGLETSPSFLWYGSPAPPISVDRNLLITARGGPVTVTGASVTPPAPFGVIDWGGTPPPFVLDAGQSRTIRVRFTPFDSSFASSVLNVELSDCAPQHVTLTGGAEPLGVVTQLKLLTPLGGENFSTCDSVMIRWGGVAPERRISIEYSANDGASWKLITDSATGLTYAWKPPVPGNRYRIRISIEAGEPGIISKIAGGGSGNDGTPAGNAILSSPSGVARRGDSIYLAEPGENRIRVIDLRSGLITTLPTPTYTLSNPTDLLISGNILFITDYGKHRVLAVDLKSGRVSPIAGDGESGFKGDNGPAVNASLQFPLYLALYGNALYFTEEGNNVIRKVDLGTRIITTVAGHGTSPAEDIPGTQALLKGPSGIAIANDTLYFSERFSHRIRRIDLRNGYIRTVIGTGMPGFSGEGGNAMNAQLNEPIGLSVIGNRLVISDAANRRLRWVDLKSRIIRTIVGDGIDGFSGDNGPAQLARLSRPAQTEVYKSTLYIPDLWNNRLRAVSVPSPASDSSSSSFTVATAVMEINGSRTLELGSVAMGAASDSLFAAIVCNRGDAPLYVDSIEITGTDAADFTVVSGIDANPILPGDCREVELRFRPSARGRRTATAVVHARCTDTAAFTIAGTGLESCGFEPHPTIDFGSVVPGASTPDSLVTRSICNNGTLQLDGNVTLNPDGGSFTIVSGAGPFSIGPGECHQVTVRFTPLGMGRANSAIDYGIPASCGQGRTLLVGRGMPDAVLGAADLAFASRFCPGDAQDTTLYIRNEGGVDLVITDARITRNNEGFTLVGAAPTGSSPLIVPAGTTDSTSIRVRFSPATVGDKSALLELVSNAGADPLELALNGRRDSVGLVPSPAGIQFRDFDGVTYPRDTTILVRNSGTIPITIDGGVIVGTDAARFALPASQFPFPLATGAATTVTVTSLAPAANGFFAARLRLGYSPRCGDSIDVAVVQGNDPPAAVTVSTIFPTLYCASVAGSDTTVTIRNDGGSDLVIDDYAITGDVDGSFSAAFATMPLIVPARSSRDIPLHFAPPTPGARAATLVLRTNMPERDFRVPLAGVREATAISSSIARVLFFRIPAGLPHDTTISIRNDGTAPIELALPMSVGPFDLAMVGNPRIAPGATGEVSIRFRGAAIGRYADSALIAENRCGVGVKLLLDADVGAVLLTRVSLPIDSALPGTTSRLPIRLSISDRQLFDESGARGYTTEISFLGTVLIPDTVTSGRIIARSYDRKTRQQKLTIEGEYYPTMNDTLTTLVCSVVLGDLTSTPLTFESFVWDVERVLVDTINGSFRTHGSCFDAGLRLVSAPRVLKVVPQPMTTSGAVEIELDEWATLSIVLVDARGATVATVASGYFPAGRQMVALSPIDLPAGAYTLVARTPFGEASARVVVVR